MGHREDLLAGAKRCLYERGYAHTTARDIVAASGTNLASIGYHFGSKEALMTAALLAAFDEWNAQVAEFAFDFGTGDPFEQMEQAWARLIEMFAEQRPLMVANFEAMAQALHLPEVRDQLAASYEQVRASFAGKLREMLGEQVPEDTARAVISFYTALGDGLTMQWLLDPQRAPTAPDLAGAMRMITQLFADRS